MALADLPEGEALLGEAERFDTIAALATHYDVPRETVRDRLKKAQGQKRFRPDKASCTVNHETGEAVIVGAPASAEVGGSVEDLILENGLDPSDWIVVSNTLSKWSALGKADPETGVNPVIVMRQVKVTLRIRPERVFPRPVPMEASRALARRRSVTRDPSRPQLVICEFDHQAPYHDPALDAAATAMHADLQPDGQVFGGDLMDFPTISRHMDHPAAMAPVNECLETGHGILLRRREAAPDAWCKKIKGNHDWRPESELLLRAERMYGIKAVGEEIPALSLRKLMHFEALGVDLIEHPLGWEHAEIELVPGPHGLVLRHGWLTGANTAKRSMEKRGRSLIVGHTHSREHYYAWDPAAAIERQGVVSGTMSRVRGEAFDLRAQKCDRIGGDMKHLFPHFAVLDNWTQGLVTVTSWPNGEFLIEHARWINGALYWRDRKWTP